MNRIDRLFAILLLLQTKRRVRAQDLARKFEVSERTIYRDIVALNEGGIPIVSLPNVGYELMEGFYLPPLVFTESEARSLVLAAKLLIASTTGKLPADAEAALAKITLILPKSLRTELAQVAETFRFFTPPTRFDLDEPRLSALNRAIRGRCAVWIRYHALNSNEMTEREIEPHSLSYSNGAWYVSAYCRLRQGQRDFRLNRIEDLKVLSESFGPRDVHTTKPAPIIARIRVRAQAARWVRERQHWGFQLEERVEGSDDVVMVYQVDSLDEFKPWLLGWGANAVPLDPPELRQMIREEALRLAEILT
jgi:predicted DNA-binding transcriptional regulator YafY